MLIIIAKQFGASEIQITGLKTVENSGIRKFEKRIFKKIII